MIKVKMGAIIKEVPDATWYLEAGWKIIEEPKKIEKIVEKIEVANEPNTKKDVKRHR